MTPAPSPGRRKRASKPRSKEGCANCRRRRVKCDEERPSCQRCIKRGLECPGYESAAAPDKDKAVVVRARQSSASQDAWEAVQITSYGLPYAVPGGQRERKALHYFCVDAAPYESATRYFTSDFWHRFVMQHCQHDAATRQAVVALSSVHLEYTTAEPHQLHRGYLAKLSPDSLEAYNKAVGKLRRYIEQQASPSRNTVLICCAIFFCLESIRGDHEAARLHFQNGTDILQAWRVSRDKETYGKDDKLCRENGQRRLDPNDDFSHLTELFGRLDLESGVHNDQHDMQTSWPFMDQRGGPLMEEQMENAPPPMRALLKLVNESYEFATKAKQYEGLDVSDVPLELREEKDAMLSRFEAWALGSEVHEHADLGPLLPDTLTSKQRSGPFPKWAFVGLLDHFLKQQQTKSGKWTFHSNPYRTMRMSEAILEWDRRRKLPVNSASVAVGYSPDIGVVAPLSLLAYRASIAHIEEAAPDLLPTLSALSATPENHHTPFQPSASSGSPRTLTTSSSATTGDTG